MQYSVLISVYKKERAEYLDICLESLMNQTVISNEIVLVQDGELTMELYAVISKYLEKYPTIFKVIKLEVNQGLGKALNIGLNTCSNQIVARMDSDDICVSTRFEKQLEFLQANPEIDIVGTWIDEFENNSEQIISKRMLPCNHEMICKLAKKRNPLNHMTVMFRKESVTKSGGYLHFLWNEDYYLWVRMIQKGYRFANLPESLVLVRAGSEMFERRGGLEYFVQELRLQREFLKMGFVKKNEFSRNILIRGAFRFMPNSLRGIMYKKLLRKKRKNI
ncbi:amylovoran biosynthesis protein AmsE [Bacillus pseudomycoides]|nr:amylovoran biosynthesis protein AmsE [Bacillus pseudomycoides]